MDATDDYMYPNTNPKRHSRRLSWPQPILRTRKKKIIKSCSRVGIEPGESNVQTLNDTANTLTDVGLAIAACT